MKKITRILAVVIVLAMMLSLTACDSSDYKKAMASYEAGEYEAASAAFKALGDYKDSAEYAKACDYELALALYNAENYEEAVAAFEALGDYKDSAELISKATDIMIGKALVGKWNSEEVDFTDMFTDAVRSTLSEEGLAVMDFFNVSEYKVISTIEFTENGTMIEGVDADSFTAAVNKLGDDFYDAFYAYSEDTYKKIAEENHMTYEQLLKAVGVADTNGLIATDLGVELDEFVNLILVDPLTSMTDGFAENGTYSVKGGIITLTVGADSEEGEFDLKADTLTLTGVGVSEDELALYPISYTRAD